MSQLDPVVVVGGGFAGVYTARGLLKRGLPVVLVSDDNHFTFTPLLHEVATGSLLPHDIVFAYESFFRNPRFRFIRGCVIGIDNDKKTVHMNGAHSLTYSYLVIATGSITDFSTIEGARNAFILKDVGDAVKLKNAILSRAQTYHRHVSVSVVGGGPTGLELVFDIERMLRALRRKAPDSHYNLRIIHPAETFCATPSTPVQAYIRRALSRAGIQMLCGTLAQEVTPTEVHTNNVVYHSDVTVLCAGVVPNTAMFESTLAMDEKGNILVNGHLQAVGDPYVFALGDVIGECGGIPVPKLAQTAVREASVVAQNIARLASGNGKLVEYRPKVIGMLYSLGFGDGVGTIGSITVKGWLAWCLWRTVYLFKTPGLWNKLRVAFTWVVGLFQGRDLTAL